MGGRKSKSWLSVVLDVAQVRVLIYKSITYEDRVCTQHCTRPLKSTHSP